MNKAKKRTDRVAGPIVVLVTMLASLTLLTIAGCSATGIDPNAPTDANITSGVQTALAAEPRLDAYTINVATDSGRVHLSGVVATMNDRELAEQVAAASGGVEGVDNYIRFDPNLIKQSAPAP